MMYILGLEAGFRTKPFVDLQYVFDNVITMATQLTTTATAMRTTSPAVSRMAMRNAATNGTATCLTCSCLSCGWTRSLRSVQHVYRVDFFGCTIKNGGGP